jgi:hypothetical protein
VCGVGRLFQGEDILEKTQEETAVIANIMKKLIVTELFKDTSACFTIYRKVIV